MGCNGVVGDVERLCEKLDDLAEVRCDSLDAAVCRHDHDGQPGGGLELHLHVRSYQGIIASVRSFGVKFAIGHASEANPTNMIARRTRWEQPDQRWSHLW